MANELESAAPGSRLVLYLAAAIAVTAVGALVAAAIALRAAGDSPRRTAPAPSAPLLPVQSEIELAGPGVVDAPSPALSAASGHAR